MLTRDTLPNATQFAREPAMRVNADAAVLYTHVRLCVSSLSRETDNRGDDYSKLTVRFNDVVNPACFTTADALRGYALRKGALNKSLDSRRSQTIEFD